MSCFYAGLILGGAALCMAILIWGTWDLLWRPIWRQWRARQHLAPEQWVYYRVVLYPEVLFAGEHGWPAWQGKPYDWQRDRALSERRV